MATENENKGGKEKITAIIKRAAKAYREGNEKVRDAALDKAMERYPDFGNVFFAELMHTYACLPDRFKKEDSVTEISKETWLEETLMRRSILSRCISGTFEKGR